MALKNSEKENPAGTACAEIPSWLDRFLEILLDITKEADRATVLDLNKTDCILLPAMSG